MARQGNINGVLGYLATLSFTFMSLMCRYSSMIALDFFSNSSSDSTGLVDVAGGVGSCLTATEG